MKLRRNKLVPIRFDNVAAVCDGGMAPCDSRVAILQQLLAIRDTMRSQTQANCAFLPWPNDLICEYEAARQTSPLGRLFRCATRLHSIVDRVIVLGNTSVQSGANAILDACCQPYWNDLSRADRGCKPRMYFDGNDYDNDSTQALLHLLDFHKRRPATSEQDRWAIVLVDRDGERPATAQIFRHFLRALESSCSDGKFAMSDLLVVVTESESRINEWTSSLPVKETFFVPKTIPAAFDVLSWPGLVPAAMMGVNVIELLQGAADISSRFMTDGSSPESVTEFVADRIFVSTVPGLQQWKWSRRNLSFRGFEDWHSQWMRRLPNQALDESHSNTEYPLVQQLVAGEARFDALDCDFADGSGEESIGRSPLSFPAAAEECNARDTADRIQMGQWCNRIQLSRVDELGLGQLFQMMLVAGELENQAVAHRVSGSKNS